MGSQIKLLIADDQGAVRCGLKAFLANIEVKIVAEAATGAAAVKYAPKKDRFRHSILRPATRGQHNLL